MRDFYKWCETAMGQVRFKPDRGAIRQELEDHYEDHVKDLERVGYAHTLARERALGAMGDPVEVGRALDKVHRPWLGWLWLVSKWAAIVSLLMLALMFFGDSGWQYCFREPAQREGDYEPDGPFFSSEGWEHDNAVRIMVGTGASTAERAGGHLFRPLCGGLEVPLSR